jgi:hypothetical protein
MAQNFHIAKHPEADTTVAKIAPRAQHLNTLNPTPPRGYYLRARGHQLAGNINVWHTEKQAAGAW